MPQVESASVAEGTSRARPNERANGLPDVWTVSTPWLLSPADRSLLGSTALWLVSVLRMREDCPMSHHLLGYLVTRALLAVPLPPLAQPPAQVPRRGSLMRGASSGNLSLLEACWSERRKLGWVEGQHIAMASRSGVSCLWVPQEVCYLALGLDLHPAGTPAVHTCPCGSFAPWRKRHRRAYGGDWAERVASPRHRGRRDAAAWLATLAHHRAGSQAIFVPPTVSPGGQPRTADTRPRMGAGAALTSRARGGRLRRTSRALDSCA